MENVITDFKPQEKVENKRWKVTPKVKEYFASVETSRDINGDWLQLEPTTFKDLQDRGKLPKDLTFDSIKEDPETYDIAAEAYINDLKDTFGIDNEKDAALWSFRPAYYKKYGGDIDKIPDDKKGSFGKSAKDVMKQRKSWLEKIDDAITPEAGASEIPFEPVEKVADRSAMFEAFVPVGKVGRLDRVKKQAMEGLAGFGVYDPNKSLGEYPVIGGEIPSNRDPRHPDHDPRKAADETLYGISAVIKSAFPTLWIEAGVSGAGAKIQEGAPWGEVLKAIPENLKTYAQSITQDLVQAGGVHIPQEDIVRAKQYGDIWGEFYETITGDKAPWWYTGLAGYSTLVGLSPTSPEFRGLMKKAAKTLAEKTATLPGQLGQAAKGPPDVFLTALKKYVQRTSEIKNIRKMQRDFFRQMLERKMGKVEAWKLTRQLGNELIDDLFGHRPTSGSVDWPMQQLFAKQVQRPGIRINKPQAKAPTAPLNKKVVVEVDRIVKDATGQAMTMGKVPTKQIPAAELKWQKRVYDFVKFMQDNPAMPQEELWKEFQKRAELEDLSEALDTKIIVGEKELAHTDFTDAINQYAEKAAGIQDGKTVGFSKLLRAQTGQKFWEDMTPDERMAEIKQKALQDFEIAFEEVGDDPTGYMLDRALDPLDPMAGIYKILLQKVGATIGKDGSIKVPWYKPAAQLETTPALPKEKAEVPGTFENGRSHDLLNYLSRYLPPQKVAGLTDEQRLELGNNWQALKDFAEKSGTPIKGEAPKVIQAKGKIEVDPGMTEEEELGMRDYPLADITLEAMDGKIAEIENALKEPDLEEDSRNSLIGGLGALTKMRNVISSGRELNEEQASAVRAILDEPIELQKREPIEDDLDGVVEEIAELTADDLDDYVNRDDRSKIGDLEGIVEGTKLEIPLRVKIAELKSEKKSTKKKPAAKIDESKKLQDDLKRAKTKQEKDIVIRRAKAAAFGTRAFEQGKKAVPAQDPDLLSLLEGLEVGEGDGIVEAWLNAFHKANIDAPSGVKEIDDLKKKPAKKKEAEKPKYSNIPEIQAAMEKSLYTERLEAILELPGKTLLDWYFDTHGYPSQSGLEGFIQREGLEERAEELQKMYAERMNEPAPKKAPEPTIPVFGDKAKPRDIRKYLEERIREALKTAKVESFYLKGKRLPRSIKGDLSEADRETLKVLSKELPRIEINIPGGPTYSLVNTKEALTEALEKAKGITSDGGTPVGAKSMLKPKRSIPKHKPDLFRPIDGKGYITTGRMIDKTDKLPKGAKFDEQLVSREVPGLDLSKIEAIFNEKATGEIELYQFQSGSVSEGYAVSDEPIAPVLDKDVVNKAVFKDEDGNYIFTDQNLLLYFTEKYNNLSFEKGQDKNTPNIIISSDGDRVGIITSMHVEDKKPFDRDAFSIAGESETFQAIERNFKKPLTRLIEGYLNRKGIPAYYGEDIIQDTLLKIWNELQKGIEFRGSGYAWAKTIAVSVAREFIRTQRMHKRDISKVTSLQAPRGYSDDGSIRTLEDMIGKSKDIVEEMDAKDRLDKVFLQMKDLPAERQTAIRMLAEGYTQKEIAEQLGVPQNTVTTWITRDRKMLEQMAKYKVGRPDWDIMKMTQEAMEIEDRANLEKLEEYFPGISPYVKNVGVIYTKRGRQALGRMRVGEGIRVVHGQKFGTYIHEGGHLVLYLITDPLERTLIFDEIRNKWGQDITNKEAEEILMEGLEKKVWFEETKQELKEIRGVTLSEKIQKLLAKIWEFLQGFFLKQPDRVSKFYDQVLSKMISIPKTIDWSKYADMEPEEAFAERKSPRKEWEKEMDRRNLPDSLPVSREIADVYSDNRLLRVSREQVRGIETTGLEGWEVHKPAERPGRAYKPSFQKSVDREWEKSWEEYEKLAASSFSERYKEIKEKDIPKGYGTVLADEKPVKTHPKITDYSQLEKELPEKLDIIDEILKIASPASRHAAQKGAIILRKHLGRLAYNDVRVYETFRKAHKAFQWMKKEDVYDFIDRMETGKQQKTPKLQKISEKFRKALDDRRKAVQDIGKGHLENFFKNYFPHIWKNPRRAENVIMKIMGKKRLEGTKSFLKQRTIMTIKEGVDRGLELVSENPVDLVALKLHEMDRYLMAQHIIKELKGYGLLKFVYSRSQPPDGWERILDNAFTVFHPPYLTKKEAYDVVLVDQLLDIARSLGIDVDRFVSIGRGSALGLAYGTYGSSGGEKIRTKFASPDAVLAHEIGHVLGYRYKLYDRIRKTDDGEWTTFKKGEKAGQEKWKPSPEAVAWRKKIDEQWRALVDLKLPSSKYKDAKPSANFQKYIRKAREKEAAMLEAMIHAPKEFERVAPDLYKAFRAFLNNHSELRPILDMEPSMVLGESDAMIKIPGFTTIGYFTAPEPVATLLNNHLAPGLRNSKNQLIAGSYNLVRGVGNLLNQVNLALSGFHGLNVTTDIVGSTLGLGWRKLWTRGQRVSGIADILISPVAAIPVVWNGMRIRKAYKEGLENITDPKLRQIVEEVINAGGRDRMDPFYYNAQLKALETTFREIFTDPGLKKAAAAVRLPLNIIGAFLEVAAKPLMQWYVPAGKMGMFAKLAEHELQRVQSGEIDEEQLKIRMMSSWDSMDNRMGQLVYDNLFWNKYLKDILMFLVRSVGWGLGSWREYAGAGTDLLNTHQRMKDGDKFFSHKMSYVLAQMVSYSLIGAAICKTLTGKYPHEWVAEGGEIYLEYMFPRTGRKNPDGSPERLSLPTYAKDIYAWTTRPVKAAAAKAHPLLGLSADLARNKDFFGTEIRKTDDPALEQLKQMAEYIVGYARPISFKNWEKMNKTEPDEKWKNLAISITGITSAPGYISRSRAQKLTGRYLSERIPVGSRTKEDYEKSQYRKLVIDRLRKGERVNFSEAKAILGEKSFKLALHDALKEPFAASFNRLTAREAVNVFLIANPEEKKQSVDILKGKVNKYRDQFDRDEIRDILKMVDDYYKGAK